MWSGALGTWNLTMQCSDGVRTDVNRTLVFTYSTTCMHLFTGLEDYGRYRDNTIPFNVTCTNGAVLGSCGYRVNGFTLESFDCNAVSSNLTLDPGWNTVNFTLNTSSGVVNYVTYRILAQKLDDTGLAGYFGFISVLVVLFLLLWVFFNSGKALAFGLIAFAGFILLGSFMLAFSVWLAALVWLCGVAFLVYAVLR